MARKRKQPTSSGVPELNGVTTEETFSSEVLVNRRKKSAATRIGRACDRCQHRKLACNPAPEGCPTCIRVDAWCTATDPLTGNPTYRGEFEYLERMVVKQRTQIEELLATLRSLGGDVKPYQYEDPDTKKYQAWSQVKASGDTRPWDRDEKQPNSSYPSGPQQAQISNGNVGNIYPIEAADAILPLHAESHEALGLPDLRTGLTGENYLGVSADNPSRISNPGSKLNMLGWEIDIAGFTIENLDSDNESSGERGRSYNRTYQSFIATAFGIGPKIENVKLPPREEALGYATGYTLVLNGFLPILHKPSFMNLLGRFYDEPQQLSSAADKVMVHMMFAQMFYQDSLRNWENPKRRQDLHSGSDMHYHFSLGHFAQLMAGHTLEDMQALAMICAHLCTFPKPEAGWLVTCMAFNKAVELEFHKAIRTGASYTKQKSMLEIEMRKRVFWSILAIHVTISGKLGRPMPIREEDYDVGFPLPVDDDLLLETGLDTSRKGNCTFLAGIEAFKVEPLFMDLYRNVYAAKRSSKDYTSFITGAERRITSWQDQWPTELCDGSPMDDIARVSALYLHCWKHEFRLLLHHPSLSLTKSLQVNESNLRTCLDVAHDMLIHVRQLQQLKSLNTTWSNCAVYILAIQTTLYGHGQLKDELTKEKLESLTQDMAQWLSIMGDIGGLLGTGRRLQNAVREQIETGLAQLEQHLAVKSISAKPPKSKLEVLRHDNGHNESQAVPDHTTMVQQDVYHSTNGYDPYAGVGQASGYGRATGHVSSRAHGNTVNAYPAMASFNYPEPSNAQFSTSTSDTTTYAISPYPIALAAQALSSNYHSQINNGISDPVSEIYTPTTSTYTNSNPYGADSQSWFQYTQTIPSNIGIQDYNPASALLQLGGRTDQNANMIGPGGEVAVGYDTSGMSGGAGQMWPFGVVDQGRGGS
ncbi:hypothetical protein MMC18_008507 [Xylographa bjoerkii]|nr:hypothetical protein [Xylographa bjoerkii]